MTNHIGIELLQNYLSRCELSIKDGQLKIESHNHHTQAKAQKWLDDHYSEIRQQICSLFRVPVYIFAEHKVGRYGKKLSSGVTLSFFDSQTLQDFYAIYNVESKLAKGAKKGELFTDPKQFRIGRRTKLYKHLLKWGLPKPRKQAEWWRQMGKLKGRMFVACLDIKNRHERLDKDSLDTLDVPAEVIQNIVMSVDTSAPELRLNIDISEAYPRQNAVTGNSFRACNINRYSKIKPRVNISTVKEQTVAGKYGYADTQSTAEWLDEYDRAPELKQKSGGNF